VASAEYRRNPAAAATAAAPDLSTNRGGAVYLAAERSQECSATTVDSADG
jgi:hypothetical protein